MSDTTRYRSVFVRHRAKTLAVNIPARTSRPWGFVSQCAQLALSPTRSCPQKTDCADSGGYSAACPDRRFRANAPIFGFKARVSLHFALRAASAQTRRSVRYFPSVRREPDPGRGFEEVGLEHRLSRSLEPHFERSPSA